MSSALSSGLKPIRCSGRKIYAMDIKGRNTPTAARYWKGPSKQNIEIDKSSIG